MLLESFRSTLFVARCWLPQKRISLSTLVLFSDRNNRNMKCEECIFSNELFSEILFIIWAVKFYKLSFWGINTFLPCRCNSNVTPVNSDLQIVTSCPFIGTYSVIFTRFTGFTEVKSSWQASWNISQMASTRFTSLLAVRHSLFAWPCVLCKCLIVTVAFWCSAVMYIDNGHYATNNFHRAGTFKIGAFSEIWCTHMCSCIEA